MTPSLDLAVIGNCTIAALVDRRARFVWGCFPRLDGDPAFHALLDGTPPADAPPGGVFSIELAGMKSCEQAYLPSTAVLVSTLSDGAGNAVEITDFAPRFVRYERSFRPPMLVRRLRPIAGRPRVKVVLRPVFGWGDAPPQITRGSNHLRYVGPAQALRLTTDASISYVAEEQSFLVDRPVSFFFGSDEALTADIDTTAREFQDRTCEYWRTWVRGLSIPFEWQDEVIRAAITLKLCSFEETGAIVAALTTSIPEAPGTQRNWDYRYCWLRDAYFVIHALNRLGATRTMEEYLRFITNLVDEAQPADLKPLYGISRQADLDERVAPALAGYRGIGPVRVGNAAHTQVQNDVYGSVVLASTHVFFDRRLISAGNESLFAELERLAERAVLAFDKPDAGPWELRTMAAVHTFSSVMCWAACDRVSRVAAQTGRAERARHWRQRANELHAVISERAWNRELKSFVASFGGRELDASLLLLAELDFLTPDDPRFVSTVERVSGALERGGLLLRYAAEDDFGAPSNAFVVCTFWYIDALAAIGRRDEARALFERVLARRNSFGLFSEDLDLHTGELWGNFPQTYSLVGLINSAVRLSKSWEEAF